jgi:hypothetical protein
VVGKASQHRILHLGASHAAPCGVDNLKVC